MSRGSAQSRRGKLLGRAVAADTPGENYNETNVFLSSRVGATGNTPQQLQTLKFFEQDLFNELIFPLKTERGPEENCGFASSPNQPECPMV